MSEEILAKESEEKTEEELSEKKKAAAEQDSSDEKDEDKEVDEGKTSKTSVKKEDEEEDEDVEESKSESEASTKEEEDDEEEVPAEALKIPKTKNGMLSAVYEKLNGLKKDELKAKYEQILKASTIVEEDEEEPEEEVKEKRTKVAVKAEDLNIDVKDDVEALVQGEDGITEEFKQKASTIFEAAVQAKVLEEVNKQIVSVEDKLQNESEGFNENFKKDMTEKVDGYLTYVVEEWMKENELAIDRGIRTELVEDFMSGLKTLFTEHYIDLPEEKVDMVDDLFTKVEDLETSLDEEINRGVELQKELAQFKKDDALRDATKDLADTETEKISKLAEGIEYENQEQYTEKLNVLKESYFPKSDAVTSEITETDETIEISDEQPEEKLNEDMKHYTSAIKRYHS